MKEIADKKKKEEAKIQKAKEEAEKKGCPQEEFFQKFQKDKFSQYDEQGIPTHNAKGEELNEQHRKKLTKEWEKQAKTYKAYIELQAKKKAKEEAKKE